MQQDLEELKSVWPLCNTFNLKPNSTVIVAGCFTGKVMDLLLTMYPEIYCYGFDPQQWAIDRAQARLSKHDPTSYNLKPYGLHLVDAVIPMHDWETDACTIDKWNTHKPSELGIFRAYTAVMTELLIPSVDLFVMNMEGAEFTLIPHLIQIEAIKYIKQLAVQWHLHDRRNTEMNRLLFEIGHTHTFVYDHKPQWTYHTLKEK